MRNTSLFMKLGMLLLTSLLIVVAWLINVTRANKDISNPNPFVHFAVENHLLILVILIFLSTASGFLLSSISYIEISKKKKASQGILDTVFLFLHPEEKNIIQFLVQNKGSTTQAEVSRLPGMNRVKAYRSLQKMADKNLVEVVPHGKIRKVRLKENIMSVLLE